jgi:DNA invertase Pin-like site-specific DNA recombinase
MSLDGLRCVGYVRVSTERQAGEGVTSPSDQRAAIEARAAKLGLTVERWYQDEYSGATVEQRPALRRLVADCLASPRKAKHPGYVLVLNDSRWGRFEDPEESAYWRVELRKRCGWLVRFAENDETENPQLRTVMRAIVATQATQKREDVRANARRGSRGTASLGFWATREPYGFRRAVVAPAGRERVLDLGQRKAPDEKVKLVPHPAEAVIVRELFQRYASGVESIASLAEWARTAEPRRHWSARSVVILLTNPAYVGDVVSGRHSRDAAGRILPAHPESTWIITRDAHPAIVDRGLFARAQEILARNAKWTTRVRTDWVVSGIVLCRCGKPYVAGGGNANRNGKSVRAYRCVTKAGLITDRCPYPGAVKKEWLESAVIETLATVVGSPAHQRRMLAALDRALAAARAEPESTIDSLTKQMADAVAKRDRLVAAVEQGTLLPEEAGERLAAVRRLIARLELQRSTIALDRENRDVLEAERDRIAMLGRDLRRAAAMLEGPALRELIRPWIASARFNSATRELTLDIRHIPTMTTLAHGDSTSTPRPDSRDHRGTGHTRRVVRVGGAR